MLLHIFTTKRKFEIKGATKQVIKILLLSFSLRLQKYALLKTPTQVTGKKTNESRYKQLFTSKEINKHLLNYTRDRALQTRCALSKLNPENK